jgi:uncharacterized protein YhhL (DUF1145 family)
MSAIKIIALVTYAVLAFLALTQPQTSLGTWSLNLLLILVVVHLIEVAVFFKACQQAGGSMPVHLLNVFLFGVIHMNDIKRADSGAA